jgi:hypothetical protein
MRKKNNNDNNNDAEADGIEIEVDLFPLSIPPRFERQPFTGQLNLCLINNSKLIEIIKKRWRHMITDWGRDLEYHDGSK